MSLNRTPPPTAWIILFKRLPVLVIYTYKHLLFLRFSPSSGDKQTNSLSDSLVVSPQHGLGKKRVHLYCPHELRVALLHT